jgi:tetratricopeptide (TPR) repeat protein
MRGIPLILIIAVAGCSSPDRDVEEAELPPESSAEAKTQAEKLYQEGLKLQEAKRDHEAFEKWKAALQLDGRNFPLVNHYGWFLAVTSPKDLRDPKSALPYARRAVRLSQWHRDNVIDTLAECYWLNRQYRKAVQTMKRSLLPGVKIACGVNYLKRQLRKYEASYEAYKRSPVELDL